MAYVVGEPCVKCKYGDCVDACPVDCFYEVEDMLVINPEECIDCDACRPECPVEAIFPIEEDPAYDESSAKHPAPYYIWRGEDFDYAAAEPVVDKEDVTHGPDWDASVANG